MYRRFYIFILIALALASCTKVETMRDVAVQFNADISPEMTVLVRGGEGQPEQVIANHAVLQAWQDNNVLAAKVEQSITPGTTQISFGGVRLAGGAEYTIYLWVDCEGYYNTSDLRNVKVAKCYDGKSPFDAFYSCSTVLCGQDDEVHNVTLKRPFAKLGFSAQVNSQLKVKFTAPTTLNLKTGEVSGARDVEYTMQPAESSVTAFDYIFATEDVSQLAYTFRLGEEEKTTSVPVKRNTKINIIYNATN